MKHDYTLQAVVFDLAGTIVDYGCKAPTSAIERAFEEFGLKPSVPVIRSYMGLKKRDHVRALLQLDEQVERWEREHGCRPTADDYDRVYRRVDAIIEETVCDFASLVPGVSELFERLETRGVKTATTTGYSRSTVRRLLPVIGRQGCTPTVTVSSDEVAAGRPAPWMCCRAAELLGVYPLWTAVKVGDTPVDIEAGKNAGMWTIGVTRTGNAVGLDEQEIAVADPDELAAASAEAARSLEAAGAHYLIDGAWDSLHVLFEIDARIHRGERP